MSDFSLSAVDRPEAEKLADLIRMLNATGHSPATSGNYSLRSRSDSAVCLVSESGVDKSQFSATNFLPVDYATQTSLSGRKPSAETAIHVSIYQTTAASCVLHSHLLEAILFADLFPEQPLIAVEGLEILKGFKGVTSHTTKVTLPCFDNTQDMVRLANEVRPFLPQTWGLLLRRHGIYVWGESVEQAKRHLEVWCYVFRYYLSGRGIVHD